MSFLKVDWRTWPMLTLLPIKIISVFCTQLKPRVYVTIIIEQTFESFAEKIIELGLEIGARHYIYEFIAFKLDWHPSALSRWCHYPIPIMGPAPVNLSIMDGQIVLFCGRKEDWQVQLHKKHTFILSVARGGNGNDNCENLVDQVRSRKSRLLCSKEFLSKFSISI